MAIEFWQTILAIAAINGIIATGLAVSNSAGALSVAHAAFAGVGGYTSAVLTTTHGQNFILAVLVGALVGAGIGGGLAFLTSRMNLLVAGLTTLAFGQVCVVLALNAEWLGGANGFAGIPLAATPLVISVALALTLVVAWRFERSRLGFAAIACRTSETAASAMGIPVTSVRVRVFALGAGIAAVGGALQAHYLLFIDPNSLGFYVSITFVVFWVVGGAHSFYGAVAGAFVLTVLPELLRFSVPGRLVMYGLVLTLLLVIRPSGFLGRRRLRLPRGVPATADSTQPLEIGRSHESDR